MRLRNIILSFSYFLAANAVFATTPAKSMPVDANQLPPAVGLLKNLNTTAPHNVPVAHHVQPTKISKKSQVSKTLLAESEAVKNRIAKAVNAEKKVAAATKARQPEPIQLAAQETQAQTVEGNIVPPSVPDNEQFSQNDLQKLQTEMEQKVNLAKEKETAEAEATNEYYVAHDHELKMQKIAKALSNHVPASPQSQDDLNSQFKQEAALKAAVVRNLMPGSSTAINVEQRANEFAFDDKQISKHTIKDSKLKAGVVKNYQPTDNKPIAANAKPIQALQPAKTLPSIAPGAPVAEATQSGVKELVNLVPEPTTEEAKQPDYEYLPAGAEIVAGNPYKDEFFIVGKDSSPKLKQMAEAAKSKQYIAPVVVAARQNVISENSVSVLIKKVASKVTHTANFAIDPFSQHMSSKVLTAQKRAIHNLVRTAQLSKPVTTTLAYNKPVVDQPALEDQPKSKYINTQRLITDKSVLDKQQMVAKPAIQAKTYEVKTLSVNKVIKQQPVVKRVVMAAPAKPEMKSLVDSYLASHPHAKIQRMGSGKELPTKHVADKPVATKQLVAKLPTHTVLTKPAQTLALKSTPVKPVPFNVRHMATARHSHATSHGEKFAPVVQNYADLLPKKTKVVVRKHGTPIERYIASKKHATVANPKSNHQYVVKPYSTFVREAVKSKPAKVARNVVKEVPEVKHAKPVRLSENTEQLPDSLPDTLPESF